MRPTNLAVCLWKEGVEPRSKIGSGIGEYRRSLTPTQEQQFVDEVNMWIAEGWLVPHDSAKHGKPACVLPLIAQVQEHKQTTPDRPSLDYCAQNGHIKSFPGLDAPACSATLRKWRAMDKSAADMRMLDIRKAYLQVRVHPDLFRYQTVLWRGKMYVMERMGFRLSIRPK